MNILIADDESVIREGIKRTIERAFPTYSVHVAANAEEAVQILLKVPVDIVLTDILMPGMDGLEFMKASRRSYPDVKWIVISAHSEFTYAQKAIRLGARDYLLKPIGKERVHALIEELTEEIRRESQVTKDADLLKINLKYLREAVFQRLVSGLGIGNINVDAFMKSYPGFYLVMVRMNADKDNHLEHFIVENVLSELIDMHGRGFVVSYDRESLVGLVHFEADHEIGTLLDELKRHLKTYMKMPFQIMESGLIHDPKSVPGAVMHLRQTSAVREYEHFERDSDKAIEVALQYIKAHYHEEDLSLEKVASVVFLNPVYFSQLFKQKTRQGYKEFVISLRMERARKLLENPKLKLAEIAERIGYQNVRHFTQIFRKHFDLTPTEYRNHHEKA